MSFSSGTADTREQLLDLFRAFAVASGWTEDRFAASGTGYVLNLHKLGSSGETLYTHLRSINNENLPGSLPTATGIAMSMSTSYSASKDAVDQPGGPAKITSPTDYYCTFIGPFTAVSKYWFFSDSNPEFLALVIRLPAGDYRHLVIGETVKLDSTMTHGEFFFGTNGMQTGYTFTLPFETYDSILSGLPGTSFLRLGADERDGWWSVGRKSDNSVAFPTVGMVVGAQFRDELLLYNSLNQFSNMAALCPITLYIRRQIGGFTTVGHIPDWRIGRRSAFLVDQEYPLGSDIWMAFPSASAGGTYSLVYRKVT